MKKKSIALIIGLMGFALLGVMAMQLYFLRQSYQMQSDLFDRSVNEALSNVVAKVTKHDALNFLNVKAQAANAGQTLNKSQNGVTIDNTFTPKTLLKRKQTGREKKNRFIAR